MNPIIKLYKELHPDGDLGQSTLGTQTSKEDWEKINKILHSVTPEERQEFMAWNMELCRSKMNTSTPN